MQTHQMDKYQELAHAERAEGSGSRLPLSTEETGAHVAADAAVGHERGVGHGALVLHGQAVLPGRQNALVDEQAQRDAPTCARLACMRTQQQVKQLLQPWPVSSPYIHHPECGRGRDVRMHNTTECCMQGMGLQKETKVQAMGLHETGL